jgi:hypothetical protein
MSAAIRMEKNGAVFARMAKHIKPSLNDYLKTADDAPGISPNTCRVGKSIQEERAIAL